MGKNTFLIEDTQLAGASKRRRAAKNRASGSTTNKLPTVTNPILQEMLQVIEPIDFRERMEVLGLTDDEKPKQRHYHVAIVEEISSKANEHGYGLAIQNDFIYLYVGTHWTPVDRNEFKGFLGDAALKMGVTYLDSRHHQYRDNLYKQFLAVSHIPPPQPEEGITLINLENNTLEISAENGIDFREHRREDFLTYVLPFGYDEEATCPQFDAFLQEVQPDDESRQLLREYVGYVFTRHLKLEKLLLLYGSGANGKSVFFDILTALLGKQNISHFSLANLNEEHNRAMIINSLLNYGSEIRGKIDTDILKQMASGEPVQARLKYGQSFMAERYAKLAFNCNELPSTVEHNEAFFRRFMILPFDVTISEEKRNPNLAKEIIAEELPGVLNWVIEGLKKLLAQGKFSPCAKSKSAVQQYRTESDSVALFLQECEAKPSIDDTVPQSTLYQDYRSFCMNDGYKSVARKNFVKRLERLGYERTDRNTGKVFYIEYKRAHIDF